VCARSAHVTEDADALSVRRAPGTPRPMKNADGGDQRREPGKVQEGEPDTVGDKTGAHHGPRPREGAGQAHHHFRVLKVRRKKHRCQVLPRGERPHESHTPLRGLLLQH
jgi:hypothetical protein